MSYRVTVAVCQDCRWEGPERTGTLRSADQVKVCPNCDSDDIDYFSRTYDDSEVSYRIGDKS